MNEALNRIYARCVKRKNIALTIIDLSRVIVVCRVKDCIVTSCLKGRRSSERWCLHSKWHICNCVCIVWFLVNTEGRKPITMPLEYIISPEATTLLGLEYTFMYSPAIGSSTA